jgi:hypothetical protein
MTARSDGQRTQRRSNSTPPHPAPAPKIPLAERLEAVRQDNGVRSLKDFWKALGGQQGARCGYEAVRKYHYDQPAPASYLTRVCEVFRSVNPGWLLTGDGSKRRGHHVPENLDYAIEARCVAMLYTYLPQLPQRFYSDFVGHVLRDLALAVLHEGMARDGIGSDWTIEEFASWGETDEGQKRITEATQTTAFAVAAPLRALGVELTQEGAARYVTAAVVALAPVLFDSGAIFTEGGHP